MSDTPPPPPAAAAAEDVPQPATSLLELPDHCLLAALQRCTDDLHTLFSAALAHSRLHHAAVASLRHVSAHITQTPNGHQSFASLLLYLDHHARHISSLSITAYGMHLLQLPRGLQLDSLCLEGVRLQVLPTPQPPSPPQQQQQQAGSSHGAVAAPTPAAQGVLAAGAPLRRLELLTCGLLDGCQSLATALAQLPRLKHLRVSSLLQGDGHAVFPAVVLQQMQQLTHLDLTGPLNTREGPSVLEQLPHLTGLLDLRLNNDGMSELYAQEQFSALVHLTSLQLVAPAMNCMAAMEPGVLAGKAKLQRFHLDRAGITGEGEGVGALLAELQQLQQLTHFKAGYPGLDAHAPSPSAYSALMASSVLHHLDLSMSVLPKHVWRHVLYEGLARTSLQELIVSNVYVSGGADAWAGGAASSGSDDDDNGGDSDSPRVGDDHRFRASMTQADVTKLVTSCPSLRRLQVAGTVLSPSALAPLQALTGLQLLTFSHADDRWLGVVCPITGLTQLQIGAPNEVTDAGLLLLTSLKELRHFKLSGGRLGLKEFKNKGPWATPVWQQILQSCGGCNSAQAS